MPPHREFLGQDTSFLSQLADYLITQSSSSSYIDLSHLTLVLPAARNERRLVEILTQRAADSGSAVLPPRSCTVGALPELLYHPSLPSASVSDRRLAWLTALREVSPIHLSMLAPHLDIKANIAYLTPLATSLQQLWVSELSPYLLQFSDVASCCRANVSDLEASRWDVLQLLFEIYLDTLSTISLSDREQERLSALEESRCSYSGKILLAACADIKPIAVEMLRQLDSEIEVLIAAGEQHSDGFSEWGELQTNYWNSVEIVIPENAVLVSEGPSEQAGVLAEGLRELGERYTVEDITISCLDPALLPYIEERIEAEGYKLREAQGSSLLASSPVALLRATRDYLLNPSYSNFSELIRHPDLGKVEISSDPALTIHDCVEKLDEHQARYLQATQDREFQGVHAEELNTLRASLRELFSDFQGPSRPLESWETPLLKVLHFCYASARLERSTKEAYLSVCNAIVESIGSASFGSCSAQEAFYLLFEHLSSLRLPPSAIEQEMELLGWLELPLDDSAVLFIAGMSEGFVPESITGDVFLPNSLRKLLGITTDDSRLARDSYITTVLLHSPRETTFLTARRDATGESLLPSRVLLRDKLALASRLLAAFKLGTSPYQLLPGTEEFGVEKSHLIQTLELEKTIPSTMSVTAFRAYLECPFRFYLTHVLRLESVDDRTYELQAPDFGTVLHNVLARFAKKACENTLRDEEACFALLSSLLLDYQRTEFGSHVLPAVRVQFQQMEIRLKEFASWQAQHSNAGWSIHRTEFPLSTENAVLELGKAHGSMQVRGRVDRLDYNASLGAWMVIDYKTAEKRYLVSSVRDKKSGEWSDVQLPLYEHFLRKDLQTSEEFKLCYLNLGAGTLECSIAEWDSSILKEGLETAREVARAVKSGKFLPASAKTEHKSELDIILTERAHLTPPARFI